LAPLYYSYIFTTKKAVILENILIFKEKFKKLLLLFISFSGEGGFLDQPYSDVPTFYHQNKIFSLQSCLALCSCNQSCAAVSFDKDTSTCFLSDEPRVLNNSEQTSRLCFVKKIFAEDVIVYGFSTNLAKGENIPLYRQCFISYTPFSITL